MCAFTSRGVFVCVAFLCPTLQNEGVYVLKLNCEKFRVDGAIGCNLKFKEDAY